MDCSGKKIVLRVRELCERRERERKGDNQPTNYLYEAFSHDLKLEFIWHLSLCVFVVVGSTQMKNKNKCTYNVGYPRSVPVRSVGWATDKRTSRKHIIMPPYMQRLQINFDVLIQTQMKNDEKQMRSFLLQVAVFSFTSSLLLCVCVCYCVREWVSINFEFLRPFNSNILVWHNIPHDVLTPVLTLSNHYTQWQAHLLVSISEWRCWSVKCCHCF